MEIRAVVLEDGKWEVGSWRVFLDAFSRYPKSLYTVRLYSPSVGQAQQTLIVPRTTLLSPTSGISGAVPVYWPCRGVSMSSEVLEEGGGEAPVKGLSGGGTPLL